MKTVFGLLTTNLGLGFCAWKLCYYEIELLDENAVDKYWNTKLEFHLF